MAKKEDTRSPLRDLTIEMRNNNEGLIRLDKASMLSNTYLEAISNRSFDTYSQLQSIAEILGGNRLGELEKSREDAEHQKRLLEALKGLNKKEKAAPKELSIDGKWSLLGLLGGLSIKKFLLGALKAVTTFFITALKMTPGLLKGYWSILKRVGRGIAYIADGLNDVIVWLTKTNFGKLIKSRLAGILVGLSMQFDLLKDFVKSSRVFKAAASGLTRAVTAIKGWIATGVRVVVAIADGIKDAFIALKNSNFAKIISWIVVGIGKFFVGIKNIFLDMFLLGNAFDGVGSKLKSIFTGGISRIFTNVMSYFDDVIRVVQKWFRAFSSSGIGKLLAKIFYPITFLLAAFDFVVGAIDGYKTEGIWGAIKGGFSGMLGGLVGGVLNMLSSISGWILEKLGFTDAAKELGEWDFMQLVKNGVSRIFDWFKLIFTDPGEALSTLWQNLVGAGGLMDLLFKPIDMFINWVMKKFNFKDDKSPDFKVGDVIRSIWNGIIDAIADFVASISWVPKAAADKIRSLKAGDATVNLKEMAKPKMKEIEEGSENADAKANSRKARLRKKEEIVDPRLSSQPSTDGTDIDNAAIEFETTRVVAEAARDNAIISGTGNGGGGSRSTSSNTVNTSSSMINIYSGSMPDRTSSYLTLQYA